jgi:hypothetical protein
LSWSIDAKLPEALLDPVFGLLTGGMLILLNGKGLLGVWRDAETVAQ